MGWIIDSSGKKYFQYPFVSEAKAGSNLTSLVQHVDPEDDDAHQIVIDVSAPGAVQHHHFEAFPRCRFQGALGNFQRFFMDDNG